MKAILVSLVICATLFSAACLKVTHSEQRVVTLPENDPNTSLDTAAEIGKKLWEGGFKQDIRKQFPAITDEQLEGVYITWNAGVFNGKKSVFFFTGIRSSGTLADGPAIADFCKAELEKAVAEKFPKQAVK